MDTPLNLIDYSELDVNIRLLVRELNAFAGVTTIGSCGGHENPSGVQRPAGEWFVTFRVAHTQGGWKSLEYIAGVITIDPWRTSLTVHTSQPGNATGRAMFFSLQGWDEADPDRSANYLNRVRNQG